MAASSMENRVVALISRLHDVQAVKFGDFTLKSGIQSPVYFDLRVMISYPDVMVEVSQLLWEKISTSNFKSICGVPYTALPIATLMSAAHNVPMLIRRKEAKGYGTNKLIEGTFSKGDSCMIVEDVVSSGSSVLETAQSLGASDIVVTEAVVLLNREQGGVEKLEANGIKLHSVFTMTDVLDVLSRAGKMEPDMVIKVTEYIATNKFQPNKEILSVKPKSNNILKYSERAALCSNGLSRRLFTIMEQKKTNLVLSADVTSSKELLQLVDKTGPHVCMVKTHVDILEDFNQDVVDSLTKLAAKHDFLIFEDRKFADIGNTVVHQYSGGLYRISEWADVVNAHAIPGPGVVQGLKKVGAPKGRACLLIAEMSSSGNLATGSYTQDTVKMAEENKDFVIGFICVSKISSNPSFLHMTPGVQLEAGQDSLGQQYLTPSEVIGKRGSDLIIVGRGIYQAQDPANAAKQFQIAGYDAYVTRMAEAMIL
ncbi:uridine 5'-monophosphate synthase [Plakobranchus ocellatus]|uniref:Uridine 5'-monophosphate synthase n=1 Tax=Plakobranchus ocellatus TaxID=259542 RepID=A0AAV4CT52_9GAST|nr:uridine 5'-monophosphate synthase [Plakobranchus ocellatus]